VARGYQPGFYALSERVRDPVLRHRKAAKIARAIVRHAGHPFSRAVCLDVGCSAGSVVQAVDAFCWLAVGLDYDYPALMAADTATRASGRLIHGDAMNLPFSDNAVDVIVCAQIYEHVPDDARLFQEIHRVLKPGGLVFFSGPNWLFPIEPHYLLPFLHWLPGSLADLYLRLTRKGDCYYEHSRHYWELRRLLAGFVIEDASLEILWEMLALDGSRGKEQILRLVPQRLWRLLVPLFPNFNWILYKPAA